MSITLTAMRADIGGVGGHLQPSAGAVAALGEFLDRHAEAPILDRWVGFTGDDITVLCTCDGETDPAVPEDFLAQAFHHAAARAAEEGLYGAGQDLSPGAATGAPKGRGPSVAQMTFEERASEAFLILSVDKSLPGAFNLPLYLAFADPMHCPGLLLSPRMRQGFRFEIMDVAYKEFDRVIALQAPEDLYNLAALLREAERFAIRAIYSRSSDDQAAALSTTRLHNVGGYLLGKDDPVAIVRVQDRFPAAGEVLGPFQLGPYVGGSLRGSHQGPLMPVRLNTKVSYFDGPPCVSCAAFSMRRGRLTPAVDAFDHPFWDRVRDRTADKAAEIRRQGFFGNAMQPYEAFPVYGGIDAILRELDERFTLLRPHGS